MIDKVDDAILGVIPRARKTLASEWEELKAMVFEAGEWEALGIVQQRETKRAYMAGAAAMISLVTTLFHDCTPEELRYVFSLHNEISAFANTIGEPGEAQ